MLLSSYNPLLAFYLYLYNTINPGIMQEKSKKSARIFSAADKSILFIFENRDGSGRYGGRAQRTQGICAAFRNPARRVFRAAFLCF